MLVTQLQHLGFNRHTMEYKMLSLLVLVLAASQCRSAPHHNNHGEVMKDINNLYMHYTDELCAEINTIHCSKTHSHNVICGSDGIQYHHHCAFAQARCKDPNLTVLMLHECQVLTHPPSLPTGATGGMNPTAGATHGMNPTGGATGGMNPTAGATHGMNPTGGATGGMNPTAGATHGMNPTGGATGGMNPTAGATHGMNPTGGATGGMNPTGGVTGGMMSTSTPMATADPAFVVIKDVFCSYSSQITCSSTPEKKICATDGNFYENQCMFSKVKCFKSDLEVATDQTSCKP